VERGSVSCVVDSVAQHEMNCRSGVEGVARLGTCQPRDLPVTGLA
jgi:hypothetical protein